MKRCPQCRRDYTDETLNFCLDDGTSLVDGSAVEEANTVVLPGLTQPSESATRTFEPVSSVRKTADIRSNRRGMIAAVFGILLVIALGVGSYIYFYYLPAGQIKSIAVLPFVNRSGDPDLEYLSDGLAESLIYRLSQLPDFKVSSTSSAFRYKGKDIDPQKIGNELGVGAVMTGRIVQRGDNLTISGELIETSSGKVLWGDQFDRKASELLSIQREIAREIVENLKLKVSPEERALTKHYTDNNEAYQFYLKGRFYWNKRNAQGLKKAIEQFQEAVNKDPSFALAYSGLADCYSLLELFAGTPSSETLPNARAAALRALEIDDSLAEAHTSIAYVYMHLWRPAEAEREFKRAIALNPSYATAHHWYSTLLATLGRVDEAQAEIDRATQLDPLSPIILVISGNIQLLRGDRGAARNQFEKALELDPNFLPALIDVGFIYAKDGREQEAIARLEKAVALSERGSEELGVLGYAYASFGKHEQAKTLLEELEARYTRGLSLAMFPAVVYAGSGDKDRAFAWLEKDFQKRTGTLAFVTYLPFFDTLRDDPRYIDLLRRMGFR